MNCFLLPEIIASFSVSVYLSVWASVQEGDFDIFVTQVLRSVDSDASIGHV